MIQWGCKSILVFHPKLSSNATTISENTLAGFQERQGIGTFHHSWKPFAPISKTSPWKNTRVHYFHLNILVIWSFSTSHYVIPSLTKNIDTYMFSCCNNLTFWLASDIEDECLNVHFNYKYLKPSIDNIWAFDCTFQVG